MAAVPSTMLALGTSAPDFQLPDSAGKLHARDDLRAADALLVVFWCNHCPYVKHVREGFLSLAREYQARQVAIVAINSNDWTKYPDDAPPAMAAEAAAFHYTFPYLADESQAVARAYQAACTPDFFLFDRERRLAYRGQMDASRPGSDVPVTGVDLRAALEAVLAHRPVAELQRPSLGCNIKWREGNEPEWFAKK